MKSLELLLEDYKRRLKTTNELLEKNRINGSIVHQRREERLNTKANDFRTFITEIGQILAEIKYDENKTKLEDDNMRKEMRKQAISVFELTKGFTGEPTDNAMKTALEMAGYVMQLTN